MRSLNMTPVRTSIRSPWQNGVAERWVGSCRRDLLDHVIALDERHLKRLLSQYISYYHDDRTHLGLEKQTPAGVCPVSHIPGICPRRQLSRKRRTVSGHLHTSNSRSSPFP